MPTGRSSAGGSHSGGGSIGGGSSHSGGSSHGNDFGRGPRRPFVPGMVIINNRPFRMSGKAGAGFFSCVLIAIVFFIGAFVGGIFMANASSTKQKIEYDFVHYQDMVASAKNHEERIVEGEIISIQKGYNRYRVIYEFETRYGGTVEGYSFYVYTAQDLSRLGYSVGEDIEIALESGMFELSLDTDSVPTDIVMFEAADDGEYIKANTNFKIGVGVLVGSVVLVVACIALGIVLSKKFAKPYEESENSPAPPKKNDNDDVTYCEYCGAVLKKGEDKCPGCGARNRK